MDPIGKNLSDFIQSPFAVKSFQVLPRECGEQTSAQQKYASGRSDSSSVLTEQVDRGYA
jgi:hypothetical protein